MIPISLRAHNFMRYADAELLFDFRSAVVIGDTGSGKSTLFVDAWLWSVYGQCRDPGIDGIIKRGEEECWTESEFFAMGERRKIKRTRSKKGRGTGTLDYFVQLESGVWECRNDTSMPKTQAKIEEDIGADYATAIVTSFMIQGESDAFAKAKKTDRMQLLARMTGATRFDGYAATMADTRRTVKADRDAVEREAVGYEERSSGEVRDGLARSLLMARDTERMAKDDLAGARTAEREAAEKVGATRQEAIRVRELQTEIATRKATLGGIASEQVSIENEQRTRAANVQTDRASLEGSDPIEDLRTNEARLLRTLEHATESYDRGCQTEATARIDLESATRMVAMLRQKAEGDHREVLISLRHEQHDALALACDAQRLLDQIERNRTHLATSKCGGQGEYASCPLIVSAVASLDGEEPAKAQLRIAEEREVAVAQKIAAHPTDPPVTDLMREADKKASEAKAIHEAIAESQRDIATLRVRSKTDHDQARTALDTAMRRESERAAARARIEASETRIAAIVARVEQIAEQRAKLDAELGDLRRQIPTVDPVTMLANLEMLEREARARVHILVAAVAGAESEVKRSAERIAEVERTAGQATERRCMAAALSKRIAHLDAGIQACRDAPQLMLESIIPAIEQKANELLSRFSTTGMQVFLRTQRELKNSDRMAETLDIILVDDEGELPYEMYSGGEHYMIDVALRIALSWALAVRVGAPLETLVIDEGFGSLDPARLAAVAGALYMAEALFEKVIVISHVPALVEALQMAARFRVTRTPGGSTIAREA